MSATGYTPISLYYSTTASAVPLAANLVAGELAINTLDGKLYYKNSSNVVTLLAAAAAATGTVSSVAQSFTGGLISVAGSPITTSGTLALTVAGTSGGIPYFSSASTWATSAALAASALVIGGGAGAAPSTTTTGTGVVTALGVNTGTAGAFVVNGGVLGTPSSGTVTNLTGTASININGTVGATTPAAGTFTSLSDSGNLTFTGTGNRITGDFSNATFISRVAFQSSTTNGNTGVFFIPNGSAVNANIQVVNNSDPTNASITQVVANATESSLRASITGTGTYLPLTMLTGGSERLRIDTSGLVGVGTASATSMLQTAGSSSVSALKTPNIAEVDTISATAATGTINYDITTQSVLFYTSNASANWTVNFRGSSGTSLNTLMQTGESISATFLVTQGSTAYYNSAVTIDGTSVTPKWQGGTAPTSGNASSTDCYTYVIQKTGSATYVVLASQTKFA
jgi:hypothetical protein